MTFPSWILLFLIICSLVFAGYAAYKLFQAQVLSPSSRDALNEALDAIPTAPAAGGDSPPKQERFLRR